MASRDDNLADALVSNLEAEAREEIESEAKHEEEIESEEGPDTDDGYDDDEGGAQLRRGERT